MEIPINSEIARFESFLTLQNNKRLLFSSKFGTGKTYFLHHFFEQKQNYEAFYLTPVSYSISSNADIYHLMQYDIIYELFKNKFVDTTTVSFDKMAVLSSFVRVKGFDIAKDIISHLGKIGKKVVDVHEDIIKWAKKFDEYKAKIEKNESQTLLEFYEKVGARYEGDEITQLIYHNISSIEKTKVLIVDDLDRIDPEHIFRLLNVFSTYMSKSFSRHVDDKNGDILFGFDKVIFVCDIDNIRNIFKTRYGSKTDFSGYIDKFYSIRPYYFDNKEELHAVAYNYVNTIRTRAFAGEKRIPNALVRILINYDLISIRKLVEIRDCIWETMVERNILVQHHNDYSYNAMHIIDFLVFLYDGYDNLIYHIDHRYDEVDMSKSVSVDFIKELAPFLTTFHKNNSSEGLSLDDLNIEITTTDKAACLKSNGKETKVVPFFQLLKIAAFKYHEIINNSTNIYS